MKRTQQRLTLIGVFVIFFVPIATAWYLRINPIDVPTVNRGTLIEPPVEIYAAGLTVHHAFSPPNAYLRDEWTVVMLAEKGCTDACKETLHATKQARTAVSKDFDRVRRLLIAPATDVDNIIANEVPTHADLAVASATNAWRQQFQAAANSQPTAAYLVDPRGFQFMRYALPLESADLLKDLKRLLKISKVD